MYLRLSLPLVVHKGEGLVLKLTPLQFYVNLQFFCLSCSSGVGSREVFSEWLYGRVKYKCPFKPIQFILRKPPNNATPCRGINETAESGIKGKISLLEVHVGWTVLAFFYLT
jgi:hypothetical protein